MSGKQPGQTAISEKSLESRSYYYPAKQILVIAVMTLVVAVIVNN